MMASATRHPVECLPSRVRRAVHKNSMYIGMVMAVARFLTLLGWLLLAAWSYSIWGSTASPLRHLLIPSAVAFIVAIIVRIALSRLTAWTRRAIRVQDNREIVQEKVRLSASENRKLP